MSSYSQANQAYTEAAVLTASPGQLVVMLYDGALRFLQQASVALESDQVDIARKRIYRAEAILTELNSALRMDEGNEITSNLRSLYLYCKQEMMQAIVSKDPEKIKTCINILSELRDAWSQASVQVMAAAESASV